MAQQKFGKVLKSKRIELDLTQKEAAEKMQVEVATIRRIEQGYTCNMENFERYCEFLGMTLAIYDRDKQNTYIPNNTVVINNK